MHCPIKLDENHLHIFHEGRKRRVFVAELLYDAKNDRYELTYDKDYVYSKSAISLGPTLTIFKLKHYSEKGKMFPIFLDRIPDKSNPAYKDYCEAQGIALDEKNPIILLGSIGTKGPSTFIFEPVYHNTFDPTNITKLREQLAITQNDFSKAFDVSKATLQRIEAGSSRDYNTLKRIQILLEFPEVALWQLKHTGRYIHREVLIKLIKYFNSMPVRSDI